MRWRIRRRLPATNRCDGALNAVDPVRLGHLRDGALEAGKGVTWWTYAGLLANTALADALREQTDMPVRAENLSITFQTDDLPSRVLPLVEEVRGRPVSSLQVRVSDKALEGLKFSVCLPPSTAESLLAERSHDGPGLRAVLRQPLRVIG